MFQMGGVSPDFVQLHHFRLSGKTGSHAFERFLEGGHRLYCLDSCLSPNVSRWFEEVGGRDAVKRGMEVPVS